MEGQKRSKPRIRKTAPTVRQRAEIARAEADSKKPSRRKSLINSLKRPFKKSALPDNRFTRPLKKAWRLFKKILRFLVPSYFVNSWIELRQVSWPSRRETWRLTLAVFIFAIALGLIVSGVDKVLEMLFKKFILSEVG